MRMQRGAGRRSGAGPAHVDDDGVGSARSATSEQRRLPRQAVGVADDDDQRPAGGRQRRRSRWSSPGASARDGRSSAEGTDGPARPHGTSPAAMVGRWPQLDDVAARGRAGSRPCDAQGPAGGLGAQTRRRSTVARPGAIGEASRASSVGGVGQARLGHDRPPRRAVDRGPTHRSTDGVVVTGAEADQVGAGGQAPRRRRRDGCGRRRRASCRARR